MPGDPAGRQLDAVNDSFHRIYDEKTSKAEREAPVMLVLADTLVVHHRGARTETSLLAEEFHLLKSVAHLPVAVYGALHESSDAPDLKKPRLSRLLARGTALHDRVPQSLNGIGAGAASATLDVVDASLKLLQSVGGSGPAKATVTRFARKMGPLILTLTREATVLQLDALDQAVEEALATFSEAERRALQVIVTGDHQARRRSVAMQYFQVRLGERPGDETRVAYGEGISDEREALALVGKRRLDYSLARAFFGDEKRLQRDVQGDAARDILEGRKFRRIGSAPRPRKRRH